LNRLSLSLAAPRVMPNASAIAVKEKGLPVSGSTHLLSFSTRLCFAVGGRMIPLSLLTLRKIKTRLVTGYPCRMKKLTIAIALLFAFTVPVVVRADDGGEGGIILNGNDRTPPPCVVNCPEQQPQAEAEASVRLDLVIAETVATISLFVR
jgi:hypothetical protein